MKPSASPKSSESCLSVASRTGSALSVAFSGACGSGDAARPRAAMRLKMSPAQLLELAGEAHDVHQRRAQIVADDIGKALDLVIGFAKVGGALVDGGLEVEVVVAQSRLGLVAGAGGSAHQEDRQAGQRDHHARPGDGDAGGQHLAAIGLGSADQEQPRFLGQHRFCRRADGRAGRASRRLAHQCRRARGLALLDEIQFAGELREPDLDRRAELPDVVGLNRVVGRQFLELVGVGKDAGDGLLVISEEFRP